MADLTTTGTTCSMMQSICVNDSCLRSHVLLILCCYDVQLGSDPHKIAQQAAAEYAAAIQKLCAAGLAELAGIHFLERAKVSKKSTS